MSKLKIGDTEFATKAPKDRDERVLAATGHSVEELRTGIMARMLSGTVAAVLHIHLPDDAPSVAELATAIAADPTAAAQVAALLGPEPAPATGAAA
ncbi:MAG: hypothetical protein PGN09_07675 [Sphingomonas fennica]